MKDSEERRRGDKKTRVEGTEQRGQGKGEEEDRKGLKHMRNKGGAWEGNEDQKGGGGNMGEQEDKEKTVRETKPQDATGRLSSLLICPFRSRLRMAEFSTW